MSSLLVVAALAGCAPAGDPFSIELVARVAGEPFRCGGSYPGLGMDAATLRPVDLRMFLSGIELLDDGGEPLELTLDNNANQGEGVVLIDFEDDTGSCATGSPSTYTTITGRVADLDRVAGLRWNVGVPPDLNHVDAATAAPPFNEPGMWWSWAGGFKYLKLDASSENKPVYYFQLGATSCSGSPSAGFSCNAGNVADIEFSAFNTELDTVVFDVAEVYTSVAVDAPPAESDELPGCMAFAGDPECPALLGSFGLPFEGSTPDAQRVFSVEAR